MPDVVVKDLLSRIVGAPEPRPAPKPEKDDGTEKAVQALTRALQAGLEKLGKDIKACQPEPCQAPAERPRRWVFKAWREKDGSMTIVAEAQEPQKEII